jgi:glycosyltransferase involved in cell wall biosynthesis
VLEMMQSWANTNKPRLSIVVPCYNEEAVLPETAVRLSAVLDGLIADLLIAPDSYVLFVDDGSKDATWAGIESLHRKHPHLYGLKLARNAGHQNALLSGLTFAKDNADIIVSIDADLQDDVEVIHQFIVKFHEGYEIVYGIRDDRTTDSWFKRTTAQFFYKMMSHMGVDIVYNHADFRLMSKRAVEQLCKYREVNLFLRGVVPLVGLASAQVTYCRLARFAGETKYPLRKMLGFAIDGITSFSVRPIRMVTVTGFLFFALSILVALYALISKLTGHAAAGWTSIVMSLWFIGGIQIMCTGLVGEYIGKIYKEVKQRPKFFVEKYLMPSEEQHTMGSESGE